MAIDVYDDCISYLDRRLGLLLDELGRRGVLDDTLVIVTSDHGEHFGDHLLFFHGCSLYRQLVQVPLVIVDPNGGLPSRVVAEPVSLRDLPATVVDLLGLERDAPFPGRSLAGFWARPRQAVSAPVEPLLMETGTPLLLTNQGREPAAKGPMKSLVAGGMHYIRTGDGVEELYALDADPEENEQRGRPAGCQVFSRGVSRCSSVRSSSYAAGRRRTAGPSRVSSAIRPDDAVHVKVAAASAARARRRPRPRRPRRRQRRRNGRRVA